MPRIPEKAVDLLATTGFAAAGVVSVVAQNLRTLAERDEPLSDRAKQVAQNSLGAVLAGPAALSDRGRQLVGRGGSNGAASRTSEAGSDRSASRAGAPDTAKTTAKTVAPAERPDRSKAEEARDREISEDDGERVTAGPTPAAPAEDGPAPAATGKTPPRAIDTSSAEAATDTAKPASRTSKDGAGASKDDADARKQRAKRKPAPASKDDAGARKQQAKGKPAAARPEADTGSDEEPEASTGTADPERSVEEQRAEQKTARKREKEAAGSNGDGGAEDEPSRPEGLPSDVDEGLVDDLQRMTVKQLRERAAQDGVPGRSGMSKDELVVALATRETADA